MYVPFEHQCLLASTHSYLISYDDGHDDSINGYGLTENDADQIFGPDARGLDPASQDTGAGCEYSPATIPLCYNTN